MEFKIANIKYEIASPCEASWDEMSGDEKCRHCSLCDKNVYNFSAMSQNEIHDLMISENKLCVRVFKREDGKILTNDCPVGMAFVQSHLKARRYKMALMSFVFLIFSTVGITKSNAGGKLMGKIAPTQHHELMGDIAIPKEHVMGGLVAPVEPIEQPAQEIESYKNENDIPTTRIEEIKKLKSKLNR